MSGSTDEMVALARCSALFTDATVVSSSSATSIALQRSTSRRINTARCRGGRCCSAAMKASLMVSRPTARSAGSPLAGSTLLFSTGWIHTASDLGWPSEAATGGDAGPRSIGSARRLRPLSRSRQTLVAIR